MQKQRLTATLTARKRLNTDKNEKNIYHLSLLINPSTLTYQCGSCIAIHPKNPKDLLACLFGLLNIEPNTALVHPKTNESMTAYYFFENHVNFYQTRASLVRELLPQLTDPKEIKEYIKLDLLTFLEEIKNTHLSLTTLISHTAPLLPRYYSISSWQERNKEQLDLMVSTMSFDHNHIKSGITSGYLTNEISVGDEINFTYHENEKFCLPKCQTCPIIMIGPGTGFAPFRGFLQELENRKNPVWLFTGAQNKKHHYYYKDELQTLINIRDVKINHAFSRDQEEKIYVQHLMQKHAKTLFSWIDEKKAKLYICGDAKKMAKDVQSTLIVILMKYKNIDKKEAKNYLKQMRSEGLLNLDVY